MPLRRPTVAGLLFLLVALPAAGKDPADPSPLAARVNRAIDRAAANLISRQADDGSWQKEDKVHPLGRTALSGLALLHAGVPKSHPAIRKAVAFLGVEADYASSLVPHSTYEAGCLALFLNALGPEHGPTIAAIADWLVERFDMGRGLWGYPDGEPDLSNTQYAVLGLKAAERHGHRAPAKVWKKLLDTMPRLQSDGGAFRYKPGAVYRATMTHAALLVMKFATEALGMRRPPRDVAAAMRSGHEWLEEHYSVERAPWGRGWHAGNYYYYMYGLERYAVWFEREEIGGHDWYREGAEVLLDRQEKNGSWGSIEDTCFAILFLRRATLTEPEPRVGEPGVDPDPDGKKEEPGPPRPAADVPFFSEWLVAGPFRGEAGEDDLLYERFVDPRAGTPVEGAPAGKAKWEAAKSEDDRIDFEKPLVGSAWAAYYAAVWLRAQEETEAVLWLASDDGLRVWLDGEEILFGHHHDGCGDDHYRVPVTLSKGRHLLMAEVENLEYSCWLKARLTAPDGRALPGVEVSLRPR